MVPLEEEMENCRHWVWICCLGATGLQKRNRKKLLTIRKPKGNLLLKQQQQPTHLHSPASLALQPSRLRCSRSLLGCSRYQARFQAQDQARYRPTQSGCAWACTTTASCWFWWCEAALFDARVWWWSAWSWLWLGEEEEVAVALVLRRVASEAAEWAWVVEE
jgi:hypothetical protein